MDSCMKCDCPPPYTTSVICKVPPRVSAGDQCGEPHPCIVCNQKCKWACCGNDFGVSFLVCLPSSCHGWCLSRAVIKGR